jgi:ATP diphosphatase
VPLALPALTRANKLGKRAALVGFEWPNVAGALDKLDEELGELRKELGQQAQQAEITDELGDVLFCVVNVCRYLGVDPEGALRGANSKFERRFGYAERRLREQGRSAGEATLEEMDRLWDEAKKKRIADSG